jgi:hypothetical protein
LPEETANINTHLQHEPNARGGRPRSLRARWLVGATIFCALALGITLRVLHLARDPQVNYLSTRAGAEWIRADVPFSLVIYTFDKRVTVFRYPFTTGAPVEHARLTVRAFRDAAVTLDDTEIDPGEHDTDLWKRPRVISLPSRLAAGKHLLEIAVSNQGAHPCLFAYCKELGIRTGPEWEAAVQWRPFAQGRSFAPAIRAEDVRQPELAGEYPSVSQSFLAVCPWLAGIFVVSLVWILWNGSRAARGGNGQPMYATPKLVRWLLVAAWIVLAANNMWRIPQEIGFDVQQHYQYVEFIAHYRALPLANDGWQMFQPPLFYLLAAPWYALLIDHLSSETVVKILRFLPLLCGLAQIEIVYRAARAVFPDKEDLQTITLTVGGLLPMQIYISQIFGNEPLAGCLTAAVVLMCFGLLVDPAKPRRPRFFILMGVLWGLAALAKLTPLLLGPLIVAAIVGQVLLATRRLEASDFSAPKQNGVKPVTNPGAWQTGLARLCCVFGACALTSGWYFLRNWTYLGKPIIFGGEADSGFVWWQDPSYRTWRQLTSFGTSLVRPVYSGAWSLWDSLYSSMWMDGFISGSTLAPGNVPWNLHWMEAGAFLAFVPMGLLLAGVFSPWQKELRASRYALFFAVAAIALYLAAIVDLYVRLPIYSTAKATYTVGLVPCYAVLVAAGAAPLMRYRLLRALIISALICWAVAAYAAYFAL